VCRHDESDVRQLCLRDGRRPRLASSSAAAASAAAASSAAAPAAPAPTPAATIVAASTATSAASATSDAAPTPDATTAAAAAARERRQPDAADLSVPSRVTVNATSARGAVVTYTVSATDSDGKPVTAACSRPSGTVFAIGQTAVTCTATDARGNTAPVQGFAVQVKGARQQLADVLQQTAQWKLRDGTLRARLAQVARVLGSAPRSARACSLLRDVRQKVRGSLGKGLTTAQRQTLSAELARIANVLSCTR
jgi:HYR domain